MSEPTPTLPAGVMPLSWAESEDSVGNTQFEAISHLPHDGEAGEYWQLSQAIRRNAIGWRIEFSCDRHPPDPVRQLEADGWFVSAEDAKAACEQLEVELGGAARAPGTPRENPDQSAPLVTDEHGFAETREVRSRWSRREGRLYLYRLWAKPEDPTQTIEKELVGEEYDAALAGYIRQHMVEALVGNITRPGGWVVPLVWTTPALGQARLECEVHFVGVRGLHWAKDYEFGPHHTAKFVELAVPSHDDICLIVAEQLARKKADYDKTLATTSVEKLQREIVKNARAVGIESPMPEPEAEGGYVLPATLEHLQAAGLDLRGNDLKQ